jgi:hypothetical protein
MELAGRKRYISAADSLLPGSIEKTTIFDIYGSIAIKIHALATGTEWRRLPHARFKQRGVASVDKLIWVEIVKRTVTANGDLSNTFKSHVLGYSTTKKRRWCVRLR